MKNILPVIILLFSLNFVSAQVSPQTKPLTQAEYVKMLYVLEKDPKTKDDLIREIRTRGIGFELNDGLRSLTRTKGRNDAELQRTLEESNRRRENPTTAQLPSEKEAQEILEKTRRNTLTAIEEMPDFAVKQQISRSVAYAGTNRFKSLDNFVVAAGISSEKKNEYFKVLSINGIREVTEENQSSYSKVGGFTSGGEFVSYLKRVFDVSSKGEFKLLDSDLFQEKNALIYEFDLPLNEKTSIGLSLITGYGSTTSNTTFKGKVWIDAKENRVLRIELQTKDVPADFPLRVANIFINYNWVTIAEERILMPSYSETRLTFRENGQLYENRNRIRFKDYQKYGTEIEILEEDIVEEVPEVDPDAPPPIKKP